MVSRHAQAISWLFHERLPQLRLDMLEVAASDTAYDPEGWSEGGLDEHCGCVAYVVQKRWGGDLLQKGGHIWNRLPCGICVDLTRISLSPKARGRVAKPRKTVNKRFKIFEDRLINKHTHTHKERT